jgi:hypothetical protein
MQILTDGSSSLDEVSNDVVEAMVKAHANIGEFDEALNIIGLAPLRMVFSSIAAFDQTIFHRKTGGIARKDPELAFDLLYKAMASRTTLPGATFLRAFQRVCSQPSSKHTLATFDKFLKLAADTDIDGTGANSKARVLAAAENMKRQLHA